MATALVSGVGSGPAPALQESPFRFLRAMRDDTLGTLERWSQLGPVARIQSGSRVTLLVSAPEAVQRVLQDNARNYRKDARFTRITRPALGDGLFSSDGDRWRAQRRVAQPAFHRQRLIDMTAAMADAVDAMLVRWQPLANSGEAMDLQSETSKLTLDVIGRTLVGQDLLPEAEKVAGAMVSAFDYLNHAFNHLFSAPLFVPTARNRAFKRAIRVIHDLVDRVVQARLQQQGESGPDLLSMLMEAFGAGRDSAGLRDNLATFLGAGTETTAVALCWAWYLLGRNPDTWEKLKDEVDSVLGSKRPTFDDLPKLTYTRMVVDEGMRLYPPAWAIGRSVIGADSLCGFSIPAGATILISPWLTHRSARYWEEPEKFDPERFCAERCRNRPEYAYYPFGGGPRMCIGDRFSIVEQTLALAMTAQRFRMKVVHDGVAEPVFTLRPRGGMQASLESVKSA